MTDSAAEQEVRELLQRLGLQGYTGAIVDQKGYSLADLRRTVQNGSFETKFAFMKEAHRGRLYDHLSAEASPSPSPSSYHSGGSPLPMTMTMTSGSQGGGGGTHAAMQMAKNAGVAAMAAMELVGEVNAIAAAIVGVIKLVAEVYKQVEANNASCARLYQRIKLLQPHLESVQAALAKRRSDIARDALLSLLEQLQCLREVVERAKKTIQEWQSKGKGILRKILTSFSKANEFDDINKELKEQVKLLQTSVVFTHFSMSVKAVDTSKWDSENQQDLRVDKQKLPHDICRACDGDSKKLEVMVQEYGMNMADFKARLEANGVEIKGMLSQIQQKLDGMGGQLDQHGTMLTDIDNNVKQLLAKIEISVDEPNKKLRFANEKAAIFWVNITRVQADSSSGISFDDFFLGCFLHSGVEEDGIEFEEFSKLRGEIRRIFDKDQNGKISMMEYDAATKKETVEDICQRLAAQMLRSSTIPPNAPQSATATPAAARAPTVVGGATSEPVYCSPSRAHRQLIATLRMRQSVSELLDPRVLFGFAAVPRRLFLPDNLSPEEEQKVYQDAPFKVAYYHQSAPHIYIMVLKHLDISINSRPESFLNIGSGTGYLSSLIAVMQSWRGYNDGIEVNGTLAQFAMERVRIFAKISKVDNSNVRIFSGNALDQRVLQRVTEGRKYQRIYVGAGILRKYIPTLLQLLSDYGRMLAPVYASPASEYGELILFQRNVNTYTETVVSNVSYLMLLEP